MGKIVLRVKLYPANYGKGPEPLGSEKNSSSSFAHLEEADSRENEDEDSSETSQEADDLADVGNEDGEGQWRHEPRRRDQDSTLEARLADADVRRVAGARSAPDPAQVVENTGNVIDLINLWPSTMSSKSRPSRPWVQADNDTRSSRIYVV